jgi:hypothetical protein
MPVPCTYIIPFHSLLPLQKKEEGNKKQEKEKGIIVQPQAMTASPKKGCKRARESSKSAVTDQPFPSVSPFKLANHPSESEKKNPTAQN